MPYKDPEHKRQWEREHREQRNAMRRKQRVAAGSGQPSIPKSMSAFAAALPTQAPKRPDPGLCRQPQGTWKVIVGWAAAIGAVLLVTFARASGFDTGTPR